MTESIYTQCSNAARQLAEVAEPFTESDVVLAAATAEWGESDFAEADRHAPQVLAALYRNSRLVRFGPVSPDAAPLTGEPDYVRKGGNILYANLEQWEQATLTTPNGEFGAILYRRDPVFKNGRRRASERDDFVDWTEQIPQPDEPRPEVASLRRESKKLRAALVTLQSDNERLARENERLRAQAAGTRAQV